MSPLYGRIYYCKAVGHYHVLFCDIHDGYDGHDVVVIPGSAVLVLILKNFNLINFYEFVLKIFYARLRIVREIACVWQRNCF
jgi:hypothetical protein